VWAEHRPYLNYAWYWALGHNNLLKEHNQSSVAPDPAVIDSLIGDLSPPLESFGEYDRHEGMAPLEKRAAEAQDHAEFCWLDLMDFSDSDSEED